METRDEGGGYKSLRDIFKRPHTQQNSHTVKIGITADNYKNKL